jgi:hypothetical protein
MDISFILARIRAGLIYRGADPRKVARISVALHNWHSLGRAIMDAANLPPGPIDVAT